MNRLVIVLVVVTGLFLVSAVSLLRAQKSIEADRIAAEVARERIAALKRADNPAALPKAEDRSQSDGPAQMRFPIAESMIEVEAPIDLPPSLTIIPIEYAQEKTPEDFTALFKTTKGYFAVEFRREWAPIGADRIYALLLSRFFNGTRIFRMVPGFVAQFGISGDPKTTAHWKDKKIDDDPPKHPNEEGTLAFASHELANSRVTQVFINLADNTPELERLGYAPVGKIIFGMDVVKSFYGDYADDTNMFQQDFELKGEPFFEERFPKLDRIVQVNLIEHVSDPVSVDVYLRAIAGDMRVEAGATDTEIAPETFKVRFECSMGNFTIECIRSWAPIGVDRFYALARNGFFNDSKFFRVIPDYIVQFGLPAEPEKYADWVNSRIPDDANQVSNTEGTIVFAQPVNVINARSTQIYINLRDNSSTLDAMSFKPFGRVIEGMDVVRKISSVYGEFPDRYRIWKEGNAYLDPYFPGLDGITAVNIVDDATQSAIRAESAPAR
ncbi:MAG: peptidylprolyl isomerase [Candidatus Hydrogenedentes bacterium]|nr:peptidylprolyl isomerase [Candidatus Hydrogenedentota bacterium]